MYQTFVEKNFKPATLAIIRQANVIIAEMEAGGYTLTVRQLYYQFVSRDILANNQSNYKRLASIVDDARKAGLIDWDAIEDRTRTLRGFIAGTMFESPQAFITDQATAYFEDLWDSQPCYCEVWVEKDALMGVISRPANRYRVPYFAARGYASSSALYAAGQRFRQHYEAGQTCYLFHLGDHDPSGLDMTRENDESVNLFASNQEAGEDAFGFVTIERLALNIDQVNYYKPPSNPAKETDSRHAGYEAKYGSKSWELDALEPAVLDDLVDTAITGIMDDDAWEVATRHEKAEREKLIKAARNWDKVVKL